jgi:hypothetical protein
VVVAWRRTATFCAFFSLEQAYRARTAPQLP